MTAPFLLEIPPRGQIEEIGQHSRIQCIGYHGDLERAAALRSALECVEDFAILENIQMIALALESTPMLCEIAAVVHMVKATNDLETTEGALAVLNELRKASNPEWIRAIAGREMSAMNRRSENQHAVCDASEVGG